MRRLLWLCSTSGSAPATCSSRSSLGHVVLISAQVNSQTRRAGARGGHLRRRSPRCSAALSAACSASAACGRGYVGLRQRQGGERGAASASWPTAQIAAAGAARAGRPQRAASSSCSSCASSSKLKTDGRRDHRRRARRPTSGRVTIDKGTRDGAPRRHGGDRAGRRRRARRRAERCARRRCSCSIDRNAAAGALIERSRAQGVVVGAATTGCGWSTCPRSADVVVGDVVVTSGIDGIYPKGFVIGRVESVEKSGGAYKRIIDQAGGRFLGARGGAGRADADAGARSGRRRAGVKAAGVIAGDRRWRSRCRPRWRGSSCAARSRSTSCWSSWCTSR